MLLTNDARLLPYRNRCLGGVGWWVTEAFFFFKRRFLSPQVKDLNGSFSKIPPISSKSKVGAKGQSFYVGMK